MTLSRGQNALTKEGKEKYFNWSFRTPWVSPDFAQRELARLKEDCCLHKKRCSNLTKTYHRLSQGNFRSLIFSLNSYFNTIVIEKKINEYKNYNIVIIII